MTSGLEMDSETSSGVVVAGALWVVSNFNVCPLAGPRVEISLLAYKDAASRDAGLSPIESRSYSVEGEVAAKLISGTVSAISGTSTNASRRTLLEIVNRAVFSHVRSVEDVVVEPEVFDGEGNLVHPGSRRSFFADAKDV